jgi:isocitrate lyase
MAHHSSSYACVPVPLPLGWRAWDRGSLGVGEENAIADGVVAEKFKELVWTEKEKKVPEMDDLEEEDVTKIAVAGKVLAPSKFHIQTINSARRPQWGTLVGSRLMRCVTMCS